MTTDRGDAGQETGSDVLIVGAGPTGLSLAAQLAAHGVRPRLIDRGTGPVPESRALAIQPRTLEVLASLGVTDRLIAAGNPTVRLRLHAPGRDVSVPLFDLGLADTAYPYLLFLSQAETERILEEHLATVDVAVQRRAELVDLRQSGQVVVARVRHHDGREEVATARYVVGCDGARSAVRRLAGIAFRGGTYAQSFLLADLEADGIDPGAAHAFLSATGILLFLPLLQPATWRMLVMHPPGEPAPAEGPVTLAEAQALADRYGGGGVRLHDPVWMTNFRLHHRAAAAYRSGHAFLAGDAAHIHSPAGGQGMNTGIQDAVNLGWKLAHVLHGWSGADLLDTYHTERAPVGQRVLRLTDRAFRAATSTSRLTGFARTRLAPRLLPAALRSRRGRAYAFRTVAQLRIRYRRSPLSVEGPQPPRRGPRAGDRLPDITVRRHRDGEPVTLHAVVAAPGWHLLLCGPPEAWTDSDVTALAERYAGLLSVHRLALAGPLCGSGHTAHYLVRPDGHVAYRAGGADPAGIAGYLRHWLPAWHRDPSGGASDTVPG
jgi:2-polyprenyl-6-methoxyphenol hydroxylase-like FAD-dependent oxidoreductase